PARRARPTRRRRGRRNPTGRPKSKGRAPARPARCFSGGRPMGHRLWLKVFKDAGKAWVDDKVPTLGAALAYYTVFSLAPLLFIAIGLAGLVFDTQAAQQGVQAQIRGTVGDAAAEAIQQVLNNVEQSGGGVKFTIIGLVILLVTASGVFAQLQESL